MSPFVSRLRFLIRNLLLRRQQLETDLDAELRAHLDLLTAQYVASGMDDATALRAARVELGGVDQVKEEVRDARMGAWLEGALQDVRYGLRALARTRTFSVTAILTLALGIGANSAIFAAAKAVLFLALPYPHADRLVAIDSSPRGQSPPTRSVSYPTFLDWAARGRSLPALAAYAVIGTTVTGRGDPAVLHATVVTPNLFQTLETSPARGRTLLPADGTAGSPPVVVISDQLWRDRFQSDPAVVGAHVTLDSVDYTVVGVMRAGFHFPHVEPAPQLWMPITQNQPFQPLLTIRAAPFLSVVGRLADGYSLSDGQAEMLAIGSGLARAYPASDGGRTISVQPLKQEVVGDVRPALLMLLGAVGLLLLIACANVASLYLARTAGRMREIAVRTALGASRGRICRQLLIESVLLALGGGAVGLLIAYAGIRAEQAVLLQDLPPIRPVGIDGAVLTFTFALSCLTGIVFGVVPALASMRLDPQEHLKAGGRGATHDPTHFRTQRVLVAGEIALAVTMLTGAGLLIHSLLELQHVNRGFSTARLLTATINLPRTKYQTPAQWAAFNVELLRRVSGLPGVERAAYAVGVPFTGPPVSVPFAIPGRPSTDGERTAADIVEASAEYFRVMQIPIERGRVFTERDTDTSPRVGIVNATFARRFFGAADPVGEHILIGQRGDASIQIVGVVADTMQSTLAAPAPPIFYIPYSQMPFFVTTFVVRTRAEPDTVIATLRRQVAAIDPTVPIFASEPMATLVDRSLAGSAHRSVLLGLLSAVAVVLTVVGIYGILAYTVIERRRELGVRMALGAAPQQVLRLMLRDGLRVSAAGIVAGAVLSLAVGPLVSALLFGVSARDPVTLVGVPMLVTLISLAACYIPARRAARIDPVIALREE